MIETELDVLRDVSRRLESAGISFILRSHAKILGVEESLERLLVG